MLYLGWRESETEHELFKLAFVRKTQYAYEIFVKSLKRDIGQIKFKESNMMYLQYHLNKRLTVVSLGTN